MADIELVIKIPEEIYQHYKKVWQKRRGSIPESCIAFGTPLPKGHGRLIDENYLLSILQCEEYNTCTWKNCSDCNREKCIKRRGILDATTIIEADKVESEK